MDSQGDLGTEGRGDPILRSKLVFLSLHLNTPKKREFIEVNWREADSNKIISTSFLEVFPKEGELTAQVGVSNDFKEAGKYIAEVLNSQGVIVQTIKFGIADVPNNPNAVNFSDYSDFRTMKTGSLEKPGPLATVFFPGDSLHYYVRLNSPKREKIFVELLDNDGDNVWTREFTTEVNTDKGSRVYSWKGVPPVGAYYIRLLNNKNFELAGFAIQVKKR